MKLKIAKLINPATQSTKMQAQFMLVGDGTQIWTKNYFTTKVGKVATIKSGQIVIYFEGKNVDGMFVGPQSDDEKRSGNWIMTKVKDVSTIGEGFISVATGEKIAIDNLRVVSK